MTKTQHFSAALGNPEHIYSLVVSFGKIYGCGKSGNEIIVFHFKIKSGYITIFVSQ